MVGSMHNDLRLQKECLDLMILHGWNSVEVSLKKGISHSTIRNWKTFYLQYGRSPAAARREKKKLGPRVNNRPFTPELKHELSIIVSHKPWLYLDEFQAQLLARTGTKVSTSAIYKVLTEELGWSLQAAEVAARERNEVDRAEHQAVLHEVTDDPSQFVFVDESAKDKNTALRRRLWRPINCNAPINRYFADWVDHSYTLLAACDINGFIPEACELVRRKRNAQDEDDEAGTIDANRFMSWVEDKLAPTLGNYALGEPRSIVVMDNASIHNDHRILQAIMNAGALLVYQSAYSPDLNPIEYCFHQYKSDLRRYSSQFGNDSYLAHNHALYSVNHENMKNYYRKVGGIRNIPPPKTPADPALEQSLTLASLLLQQQQLMLCL